MVTDVLTVAHTNTLRILDQLEVLSRDHKARVVLDDDPIPLVVLVVDCKRSP